MSITPSWPGCCSTRSTPSPIRSSASACASTSSIDQLPRGAATATTDPSGAGDGGGLGVVERLDEITGIGRDAAQTIIAEVGLDMTQFPTAGHLVSWAKLTPRTIQSGPRTRSGRTGKGNPYLKGVLGEAAAAAGRTDTFLGERYRRLVRRRGKLRARRRRGPFDPRHRPSDQSRAPDRYLRLHSSIITLCAGRRPLSEPARPAPSRFQSRPP